MVPVELRQRAGRTWAHVHHHRETISSVTLRPIQRVAEQIRQLAELLVPGQRHAARQGPM